MIDVTHDFIRHMQNEVAAGRADPAATALALAPYRSGEKKYEISEESYRNHHRSVFPLKSSTIGLKGK